VGERVEPLASVLVAYGIEDGVAVGARLLGLVHGMVGLAQQLVAIHLGGLRVKRDAHACCGDQCLTVQRHWGGGGTHQACQQGIDGIGIGHIKHHRHKFVAAQAAHGVTLAQCSLHALGQRGQQAVTHGVAVGVVHGLETVQIQVHHGQPLSLPRRVGHGLAQTFCQQHPVGQARQRVVVRHVLQLLFVGL
jgi:hypothetical protein